MQVRTVVPSFRRALPATMLVALLLLLLAPAALAEDTFIEPVPVENTAGRLDTASLYDLGDNTAALHAFLSDNESFTRVRFWKSAVGAFNTDKAKLAHGDLNADGKPDVLVLYDRGSGISALYAFLNTGTSYVKTTAWKGTLAWGRAKLSVADIDGNGTDDAYVLYKTGTYTSSVQGFLSTITDVQTSGVNKVVMTKKRLWPSQSYVWDRAKVAATDADGDGRDDLVSLYRTSLTTARLDVFRSSGTAVAKERWWKGDFKAARAKLACGDLDSDGKGDAFVLYDRGDASSSLRVFRSTGSAYLAPVTWWKSALGGLNWWTTKLACGDVTSDGKADAVLLSKKSLTECRVRVATSTGTAFNVRSWWTGSYRYGRAAIACAPSTPLVVPETTKVLEPEVVAGITTADGETFVFSNLTETSALAPGDVIVGEPCPDFPEGFFRKVVSVNGTTVITEYAYLEDAMTCGEIAFDRPIVEGDFTEGETIAPGITVVSSTPAPDGSELVTLKLTDVPVSSGITWNFGTPTVTLSGRITLSLTIHFDFEWDDRWWDSTPLERLELSADPVVVDGELTATIAGSYTGTLSKPFTLPVPIPPIPVGVLWIQPELAIVVGVTATCEAGVTAEAHLIQAKTSLGVRYGPGGWDTWTNDVTYDTSFEPPTPCASFSVKAFVGPVLTLKLISAAGPFIKTDGYLRYERTAWTDPWWTLKLGMESSLGFTAGVNVGWFRVGTSWESGVLTLFEILLAQSTTPPPPEPTPTPTPTPTSTPTPTPTPTSTEIPGVEFPICTDANAAWEPAVDGNIVVWENYGPDWYADIYGYDILSGTRFPVSTDPSMYERCPDISGNNVVWVAGGYYSEIWGCDLTVGTPIPIMIRWYRDTSLPRVSGNIVVWSEWPKRPLPEGESDVYGFDLATQTEFPICTAPGNQGPGRISGSIVVWVDDRNGNYDIYGYDLATKTEFPICTDPADQGWSAVSGDVVIWIDDRNGRRDIYGYNLVTGTEFFVHTISQVHFNVGPEISGDVIVWADERHATGVYNVDYDWNWDIYGYDLRTRTEFPICLAPGWQDFPRISGDVVVWQDQRDFTTEDVYGLILQL